MVRSARSIRRGKRRSIYRLGVGRKQSSRAGSASRLIERINALAPRRHKRKRSRRLLQIYRRLRSPHEEGGQSFSSPSIWNRLGRSYRGVSDGQQFPLCSDDRLAGSGPIRSHIEDPGAGFGGETRGVKPRLSQFFVFCEVTGVSAFANVRRALTRTSCAELQEPSIGSCHRSPRRTACARARCA
jgi:hypothetical protein